MPTSPDAMLATTTADLIVVARAYRAAADRALADLDLSQASAWPIVMIGRLGEGVRQGAVADALGIEGPTLVRVLDQLVASGYIVRQEDATDRRAKTLHLTPAGRALREKVERILIEVRRDVFSGIDAGDIQATVRVLAALKARLKCVGAKGSTS